MKRHDSLKLLLLLLILLSGGFIPSLLLVAAARGNSRRSLTAAPSRSEADIIATVAANGQWQMLADAHKRNSLRELGLKVGQHSQLNSTELQHDLGCLSLIPNALKKGTTYRAASRLIPGLTPASFTKYAIIAAANESEKSFRYIEATLRSPFLRIIVHRGELSERRGGHYNTQNDLLILAITPGQRFGEIIRLVRHEFWHAYLSTIHAEGKSPAAFMPKVMEVLLSPQIHDIEGRLQNPTSPIFPANKQLLTQFQAALIKGCERIIDFFQARLVGKRIQLSKEDQVMLKKVLGEYAPEEYEVTFADPLEIQRNLQRLARGEKIEISYHGLFPIYIQRAEKNEVGMTVFKGFATQNPSSISGRLQALAADAIWIMRRLPVLYRVEDAKAPGYLLAAEREANIYEMGTTVLERFFPEMLQMYGKTGLRHYDEKTQPFLRARFPSKCSEPGVEEHAPA